MDVQTEKSFQKQPQVFLAAKKLVGKKPSAARWFKSIGLGIKTPELAKTGNYIDAKCPFTSSVSIRGAILRGRVISTKMRRTIIVRRNYLHYVKKYNRYERRHKHIAVHISPAFTVQEGDEVVIGECRPLSKSVRFNVVKVSSRRSAKLARKQFLPF